MSDSKSTPFIVAAAIKWKGIVYTGTRHGFIIKQLVELGQLKDKTNDRVTDEMQGFLDSNGIFLTRAGGRSVAVTSQQVKPDHGTLYSEDLW